MNETFINQPEVVLLNNKILTKFDLYQLELEKKKIFEKHKTALLLLLSVSTMAVSGYLGIILKLDYLKYTNVILEVFILMKSINIIYKNINLIKTEQALPILFIIAIYPLIRIFTETLDDFTLKTFINGLIIGGTYYIIIIAGLAIAVVSHSLDYYKILRTYACLALPPIAIILYFNYDVLLEYNIGAGHMLIDDIIIPLSLLSLNVKNKNDLLLGWASIIVGLIVSSVIWSRSYSLVFFYIAIASLIIIKKQGYGKVTIGILICLVVSYLSGLFSFFEKESLVQEASLVEKYQFSSLQRSVEQFMNDFDFVKLFYWDGNSRSIILIDAFKDFDIIDCFFGKGIFGKYLTTVETEDNYQRSIIEIGWAQETFRWGVLYTIMLLYIMIRAIINLKNDLSNGQNYFLLTIIIIKLLDGFILGLPLTSCYNFIVFWGVMATTIKKDQYGKFY